jgi:hypothetical protein
MQNTTNEQPSSTPSTASSSPTQSTPRPRMINLDPRNKHANIPYPTSKEERQKLKARLDAYLNPLEYTFEQPPETMPQSKLLQIANLTPDMLAFNLRAGYFPHISMGVLETIRRDLSKAATTEVYQQEYRFQRPTCRSTLLDITPVRTPEIEQRIELLKKKLDAKAASNALKSSLSSSSPSSSSSSPAEALVDTINGDELSANHDTRASPDISAPAELLRSFESSLVDYESTWPTKLMTLLPERPIPHAPYPNVTQETDEEYGKKIETLGKELWRVDRCGTIKNYEVRYYHNGDIFFPKVYPTTCKGLFEMAGTSFKEWISDYLP